ncbi:MAG: MBL fold metallo-hydrolase [Desulfotignum sp.]|nr:MBL fold metallo-hydrolase [Desulfotignum sp.]
MIDTGLSHLEKEVAGIAQENKIERIYLTHHHEDHSGNAAHINKSIGADVYGHRLTALNFSDQMRIWEFRSNH